MVSRLFFVGFCKSKYYKSIKKLYKFTKAVFAQTGDGTLMISDFELVQSVPQVGAGVSVTTYAAVWNWADSAANLGGFWQPYRTADKYLTIFRWLRYFIQCMK